MLYDLYFIIMSSIALDSDVVYSFGYNANIRMSFPRLLGEKVTFNMAGLEWGRSKFGRMQQFIAKSLYLLATVGASRKILAHIPKAAKIIC